MLVLRYGIDSSVGLEFAEGVVPQQCGNPRGEPVPDLAAAVVAALEAPLDFPPLRQSTTLEDRVVLSLGRGVPRAAEVTAGVVRLLIEAGVTPDGIGVMRTEPDVEAKADDPRRLLKEPLAEQIRLRTHDAADPLEMAYLAANEAGQPVLLSRSLTDADLILPIGCCQAPGTPGYFGIHSSIFPTFSDEATQARFRERELNGKGQVRRELKQEVDQVAWLLGVNFTIQVVPGAGEEVLHVVAGQSDTVQRQCRALYQAAWTGTVASRASLVVATIAGGPVQQTWENFGCALARASRILEDGGAVAVCCDLAAATGPAIQRMAGARSRESAMRRIVRDHPVDAVPAARLAEALDRGRVYLLSRLDPALVEQLDMTPIEGQNELNRLVHHHASCTILSNAPHAVMTVENE